MLAASPLVTLIWSTDAISDLNNLWTWSQLSKARLSLLVLLTAAVGFVVAPADPQGWWMRLLWNRRRNM